MVSSKFSLAGAMIMLVIVATGCQGSLRGPQVFAGFNGSPDCAPGPKPCPRNVYPEFPLPPGGPYLTTPGAPQGAPPPPPPARLDLNNSGSSAAGLTIKQK